jgi:VanZ family protein
VRLFSPPIIWMALIFWFSSGYWNADQTGAVAMPLFSWLLPWATAADLEFVHGLMRKIAHVTEYAILAILWQRALTRGTGLGARSIAGIAFAISAAWAGVDEWHQSTVATRTGSRVDVVIDASGAVIGLLMLARDWRTTVDRTTTVVLWIGALGGVAVLLVDGLTGAESRAALITTPLALLALVLRRWLGSSRRPAPEAAAAK